MKKILFYTDTPNVGGAEKQMLLLAKHLKQSGYSVSLAYGKYSRLKEMHEEFALHCDSIFILNALHKHDPRHYFELKRILKAHCPDLVHLHLWNPGACRYAFFACLAGRQAAASGGVPVVTTEHDPFELSGLKKLIKKVCLRRTVHTIAISKENKKDLQTWYDLPEERISLVHNGIELSQPEVILRPFAAPQDRFRRRISPTTQLFVMSDRGDSSPDGHRTQNDIGVGDDIVITCVAELHERKGHKYLFEAFNRLQKTIPSTAGRPSLRLMLVGRGPLERELKERYGQNPRIHFLGWRDDVPEILRASDLFVLPSLKEAFGLSVLEAMASGVAVVATDSGGVKDIIENGKSGLLVPPGNAEKLAEAISVLLHNPDQKRDIEKAALKRVREFSAERMAEETMRVYTQSHSEPRLAGRRVYPLLSNEETLRSRSE